MISLARPNSLGNMSAYAEVRARFLGDARAASMLLTIPQLVWPEFVIEVEVLAAKRMSEAQVSTIDVLGEL